MHDTIYIVFQYNSATYTAQQQQRWDIRCVYSIFLSNDLAPNTAIALRLTKHIYIYSPDPYQRQENNFGFDASRWGGGN